MLKPEWMDKVVELTAGLLEDCGGIDPTAFLGNAAEITHVAMFTGEAFNDAKDLIADKIRQEAREFNADYLVFVSEAWTVNRPRTKTPKGSLEFEPDRVEIVIFSVDGPQGATIATAPIERSGEQAKLGPVTWVPAGGSYEGRFVGLLPRRESVN